MVSPYDSCPDIIVIDDERYIPDAENYQSTDEALLRLVKLWGADLAPDSIYLDHDMGPNNNIWDIVSFFEKISRIEDTLFIYTAFYVHSMNPVGAGRIFDALNTGWPFVYQIGIPDNMKISS